LWREAKACKRPLLRWPQLKLDLQYQRHWRLGLLRIIALAVLFLYNNLPSATLIANSPRARTSGALLASSDLLSKSVLLTANMEPLKAILNHLVI